MLHRITGRATKCGPSAIAAIAGVPTHEAAAVIRRLFDRRTVNGVFMDELAAALHEFGWTPDYALRHPRYRERRFARRNREAGLHDEWYDFVYEDFQAICRILGVELGASPVKLVGGSTRDVPQINWTGFSSQGDGASFAGFYRHARGAARAIRIRQSRARRCGRYSRRSGPS